MYDRPWIYCILGVDPVQVAYYYKEKLCLFVPIFPCVMF
jgi:hypothetical protein